MSSYQATLENAWALAWRPPDRSRPSEWAERYVSLPASVRTQEFRKETTPWTTPIIDLLDDPSVEFITLLSPTQSGKSNIFEVGIPWLLCNSPGNCMITCQTEDDVRLMSESRLWKVFTQCKPVSEILQTLPRDAKTKTRILFPQCFVELQGPALSSLQSKSIRYAINDEAWMYKPGTLSQIVERTSAVWNRKILTISQGSEAGDDLDRLWQEGSQELYSYRCEKCGETHPFSMKSIKWDDTPDTRHPETREWNWQAVRDSVRHFCLTCGHETPDTLENRRKMSSAGLYVRTNEAAPLRARSFRVDATAVYWMPWADLTEQLLRAKAAIRRGDIEPLKIFVQKKEASPWAENEAIDIDTESITSAGYTKDDFVTEKTPEELVRVMSVDVQNLERYVVIRAIAKDSSSRLLFEGVLDTWEEVRELQQRYGVPDKTTVVDGGHWSYDVWKQCAKYDWTSLVGRGVDSYLHTKQNGRGQVVRTHRLYSPVQKFHVTGQKLEGVRRHCRGYYWSNTKAKDILARMREGLAMPWLLPDDVSQDYKKQIYSEVKSDSGRWDPRYKGCPNHFWDCEAMIVTTMAILGVLGGHDEGEASESSESPPDDPPTHTPA